MSLLVFHGALLESGLLACSVSSEANAAMLPMSGMHTGSRPCGATPSGHDRGCSQPSGPADCGSALACVSPIAAVPVAELSRAIISHEEPASGDDLAPPARSTAPEPPPPRA